MPGFKGRWTRPQRSYWSSFANVVFRLQGSICKEVVAGALFGGRLDGTRWLACLEVCERGRHIALVGVESVLLPGDVARGLWSLVAEVGYLLELWRASDFPGVRDRARDRLHREIEADIRHSERLAKPGAEVTESIWVNGFKDEGAALIAFIEFEELRRGAPSHLNRLALACRDDRDGKYADIRLVSRVALLRFWLALVERFQQVKSRSKP